jgi:MbtH protein
MEQPEDKAIYEVVVNHEEQYSTWPADRPLPAGWSAVGKRGTKAECLESIGKVWTDIRPRSLRDALSSAAG